MLQRSNLANTHTDGTQACCADSVGPSDILRVADAPASETVSPLVVATCAPHGVLRLPGLARPSACRASQLPRRRPQHLGRRSVSISCWGAGEALAHDGPCSGRRTCRMLRRALRSEGGRRGGARVLSTASRSLRPTHPRRLPGPRRRRSTSPPIILPLGRLNAECAAPPPSPRAGAAPHGLRISPERASPSPSPSPSSSPARSHSLTPMVKPSPRSAMA